MKVPLPLPEDQEEMIMHLERDQLSRETLRPVPRAHLGSAAVAALWALRLFVLAASAMVLYTFIVSLS